MKYLLAYDGSSDSKKALNKMAEMMNDSDQVVFYHGFQPPTQFIEDDVLETGLAIPLPKEKYAEEVQARKTQAMALLETARDMLIKKIALKQTPTLVADPVVDPREGIIQCAQQSSVDIIVRFRSDFFQVLIWRLIGRLLDPED